MDEIWRLAPMFERYMISNHGRVKNKSNRLLNTTPKKGYIRVTMVNDSNQKRNVRVHRLVCLAFVPNVSNKPTVNHIDRNVWNNHVDNLEWATVLEQNRHKRTSAAKFEDFEISPFDIWIEIPPNLIGDEKGYSISPSGKIKNRRNNVYAGNNKDGYLWVNVGSRSYQLHVLIAKVFLPNMDNKPYVNHKDGNKGNAKLSNLEWCTPSENVQHAIANNLLPYCQQIKVCDVVDHTITSFHSIRELERTMKISHKTIKKYIEQRRAYKNRFIFKRNSVCIS
jgi:hypothetical protein